MRSTIRLHALIVMGMALGACSSTPAPSVDCTSNPSDPTCDSDGSSGSNSSGVATGSASTGNSTGTTGSELTTGSSSSGSGSSSTGSVGGSTASTGSSSSSGGSTTGAPPPCPPLGNAVPVDIQFACGGTCQFLLASEQVGYMQLPTAQQLDPSGTWKNFKVQFDLATYSPTEALEEISINRCPGVIDTSGSLGQGFTNPSGGPMLDTCYTSNTIVNAVIALNWFSAPGADAGGTDWMASYAHVCEAYDSFNESDAGPLYVNIRWTYPGSCSTGNGDCGFTGNYNVSGYTP